MVLDYKQIIDDYRRKRSEVNYLKLTREEDDLLFNPFSDLNTNQIDDKRGVKQTPPGVFGSLFNDFKRGVGVAGDFAGDVLGETLTSLDRPRGALFGAINNIDQGLGAGLEGAGEGFKDPGAFRGTDIFGINKLSDRDLIGGISLRDAASFGAEAFLDPTNIAVAGVGAKVAGKLGRAGVFAEPVIKSNSFTKRLAAESVVAGGGAIGAQVGAELLPGDKYDWVAQLAGGLAGATAASVISNRILPQGATATQQLPFEDVYNIHYIDEGPIELEGQIVRRSVVGGEKPKFKFDEVTGEDLIDVPGDNVWQINQKRNKLVQGNQAPQAYLLQLDAPPAEQAAAIWSESWVGNSASSPIKMTLDDYVSDVIVSPENMDSLRQVYRNGDNVREAIRKSDPYYNPVKDTTVLFRGENIPARSEGGQYLNKSLNDPQIAQPYTTDPATAAYYGPKVKKGFKADDFQPLSDDNFIMAREVAVDDIAQATPNTLGEYELIVIDSKKLDDEKWIGLTDKPKTAYQKAATRDRPFADSSITVKGAVAAAGESDNIKDLTYIPSEKALANQNKLAIENAVVRDGQGRFASSKPIPTEPGEVRALALRDDDVRPNYQRGSVQAETVGTPTPESIEARRIEKLNEQVRQSNESEALRFFEQEDTDITERFKSKAETSTEPTIKTRFNPEKVNSAPTEILGSLESRRVQMSTYRKELYYPLLDAKGLNYDKSMTKSQLLEIILADEYKGDYTPLYVTGGGGITQKPLKMSESISSDIPPVLGERVAKDYYNTVNTRELPPTLQTAVDKVVKDNREVPQDVLEKINQSLKMGNASGDLSWTGIQGLQSLASWVVHGEFDKVRQFFSVTGQAISDPDVINESINQANRRALEIGAPTLDVLHEKGLSLQSLTGIEDIGRGLQSPITKIPIAGSFIERANQVFAIQGDYTRIQNFYDAWARYGGPKLGDDEVQSLINAVNRMTGVSAKNRLGSHANMMLFAPRFIQSQIETVVKAFTFNNSIEARMARRGLGSLVTTAVGVTVMANELRAMGSEDYEPFTNTDFRLTINGKPNSNFMRIKNVFGTDVSVLGPWDTLLRNALYIMDDPVNGTKEVLRSKSAPLLSIAWNVWSGRTFLGEKFDITNPNVNMLEETFLPFAWRDIGSEPLAGNIFGVAGFKATPLTSNEQLEIKMRNAGFDANDPLARRQWLAEHPEDKYKANTDEQEFADLVRGNLEQRNILNETRTVTNQQTLPEFVENRRILQRELRNKLDTIFGEDFAERTPANDKERWIQEYYGLFDAAKNPITGDVNGTAFDLLLNQWAERNGRQALSYVNEFNLIGNLELENEYLSAIRELDSLGYFDLPRLTNMRSDLDENSIFELRQIVSTARLGNPRLAAVDYSTAAWQVLREQGYSGTVIRDVVNAGKDKFQSREFQKLKESRPDLIAWFNPSATYSTLQQLRGLATPRGGATSARRDAYVNAVTR